MPVPPVSAIPHDPQSVSLMIQFFSTLVSAALAGGVAYGVIRTKLKQLEEDRKHLAEQLEKERAEDKVKHDQQLVELTAQQQTTSKEIRTWMQDRKHSVRTVDLCDVVQARCQQRFCGKVDKLLDRFDHHVELQEKKWSSLSGLLGGLCAKLEIEFPNLNP